MGPIMLRDLSLLLLVVSVAGCEINGNIQDYPGASVFEAPDQGFHFHYLAPPWRRARGQAPEVAPPLIHLVVKGSEKLTAQGEPATYDLAVTYHKPGELASLCRALCDAARQKGRTITREVSGVTSLTNEAGYQYLARRDGSGGRIYERELLFADRRGRPVLMSLAGVYPLEEQDPDDVLLSFSKGPDPGTEVPARRPDARPWGDGTAAGPDSMADSGAGQ